MRRRSSSSGRGGSDEEVDDISDSAAASGVSAAELKRRMEELEEGVGHDPAALMKRLAELGELAEDAVSRCVQLEEVVQASRASKQRRHPKAGLEAKVGEHSKEVVEDLRAEIEELEQRARRLEEEKQQLEDTIVELRSAQVEQPAAAADAGGAAGGAAVNTLINRLAFKKKEQRILQELDESDDRQAQLLAQQDELARNFELAQQQIEALQKDIQQKDAQLAQSKGANWKVGWQAQLQKERAARKFRQDMHDEIIMHNLDAQLQECAEDLGQLKELRRKPGFHAALNGKKRRPRKGGGNLADELGGARGRTDSSQADETRRGVSFAPSIEAEGTETFADGRCSFKSGVASARNSAIDAMFGETETAGVIAAPSTRPSVAAEAVAAEGGGARSLPADAKTALLADTLAGDKDAGGSDGCTGGTRPAAVPGGGGAERGGGADADDLRWTRTESMKVNPSDSAAMEMASRASRTGSGEHREHEGSEELAPELQELAEDETQRKLMRALHLIELLKQQNAHLQDDVEHLEEFARMFAKVERGVLMTVVIFAMLIVTVCASLFLFDS